MTSDLRRAEAAAELRRAKIAFTRAATAALRGERDAVEMTTAALADLDAAFARLKAIDEERRT